MSEKNKKNILIKITGSIAAYKCAALISKLVQSDYDVKVVATESALKFIGRATLEGLSHNFVYTDSFEPKHMMSHISLNQWADLVIVCPASANTINKMAQGIADNLVTSLFLAHDRTKPYLIAPAMNTAMYEHPATQNSLKTLASWGATILPTADGHLACGDSGKGKMLEPEQIFEHIQNTLGDKNTSTKRLNVLITSGGTRESIDGVRFLTNLSTGKTGAVIADYFSNNGHTVTCLCAQGSVTPTQIDDISYFEDHKDLKDKLEITLSEREYAAVIHLAAVSDYSIAAVETDGQRQLTPLKTKIDSKHGHIKLELTRTHKIVDGLKSHSRNKDICLVAFKFTTSNDSAAQRKDVENLFEHARCDYVVLNDLANRTDDQTQSNFTIYDREMKTISCSTVIDLAQTLESLLSCPSPLMGEGGRKAG